MGFGDGAVDSPANLLRAVKSTALPASGAGALRLNGVAVTAGQVSAAGDIAGLVYTPVSNANGTPQASFTFQVIDNGGTANGGINTDPVANTHAINVTPVNDPPVSTDDSVTTPEDTPKVLALTDFGSYSDVEATAIAAVKITTLETNGSLEYETSPGVWAPVTLNQVITAADITAGKLRFAPDANENGAGYTTVGFPVSDGTSFSATANTLTVNVTPVNDAPDGTDKTVTISEDASYTYSASDFGFVDAAVD